jgi:hypothetical protein
MASFEALTPTARRSPTPSNHSEPFEDAPSHIFDNEDDLDVQLHDDHSISEHAVTDERKNTQPECSPQAQEAAKERIARLLDGKEREWSAVIEKKPLNLLDLPVDILKEIIQHLPHTNDLTSLALTHSALHTLTVSHIYARFDIVWPDETSTSDQRSGVDALTYGLATLVMAAELFRDPFKQPKFSSSHEGSARTSHDPYGIVKRRRGNYYAKYTKKFSLGNGPSEYVSEYLISKEGGKMLGTLVAIAIARMRNLETFVWDMPTGVLGDIWMALSSLADDDDRECPLERLWIRWHDNRPEGMRAAVPPPPVALANVPPPPNPPNVSGAIVGQPPAVVPIPTSQAIDRVEHPTFSVIPALKSLSVLDIDELPYLDEMSVLIARSKSKLRNLRVGVARHAITLDWANAWEDGQQVDYNTTDTAASAIEDRRLGGVLGVIVGRVYNLRRTPENVTKVLLQRQERLGISPAMSKNDAVTPASASVPSDRDHYDHSPHQSALEHSQLSAQPTLEEQLEDKHASHVTTSQTTFTGPNPLSELNFSDQQNEEYLRSHLGPDLQDKLRLDTLELERVQISVPIMLNAFDWTMLTNLTLLNCQQHENLWRALRIQYSPFGRRAPKSPRAPQRSDYQLNLKKIHTNTVSPALITFLKESLAPNSLEVLFLQEGRGYTSNVLVESIYKGPIKRHRASLKKLMLDSSERGPDGIPVLTNKWRKWMVNREILTFITSGKMRSLRELAVVIDYRDWVRMLSVVR